MKIRSAVIEISHPNSGAFAPGAYVRELRFTRDNSGPLLSSPSQADQFFKLQINCTLRPHSRDRKLSAVGCDTKQQMSFVQHLAEFHSSQKSVLSAILLFLFQYMPLYKSCINPFTHYSVVLCR